MKKKKRKKKVAERKRLAMIFIIEDVDCFQHYSFDTKLFFALHGIVLLVYNGS